VNKCGYTLGKKRREEAKKAERRRECASTQKQTLFWDHEKHLCFRQKYVSCLSVRSFLGLRTGLFFSPFSPIKQVSRNQNSSFLKHRIHPKHGSGRTSSLHIQTQVRLVLVLLRFLFELLFFKLSFFVLLSSVWYMCKEKEKSMALISSREGEMRLRVLCNH